MKTHSFFKRTCLFLALFSWLLPMNLMADVTAEWGEWGSPKRTFPIGSADNLNGIILTPGATIDALAYAWVGGIDDYDTYNMNISGKYVDITLASGVLSSVQFGVWTADATLLKLQFCKEATYTGDPADLLGDPQVMHDPVQAGSGLQTIIAPANAKSARIYKDGSDHWQCYLYRLIVTAAAGCASPETATFGKGDAISGSVADIEACEGSNFIMPNQGTMYKPGYLFTGWKLNNAGDVITAGTSYTMPAGGASFTAQWEEDLTSIRIPTTSILNSTNRTGGSSETIDFYEETCVYLYNTHYVEWDAYITPGSYTISMKYGAPQWGIIGTFSIIDPLGIESPRVFYTQPSETNNSDPIYRNPSVMYDLTGLTDGKLYTIKVEHDWGGSLLSIAHIEFTPLGASHNVSFAQGDASVTGSLPADATCAGGGSYTLPAKGDLAWSGHMFTGWSDGSNTYAAGASYTMPNHDVTFTAQWDVAVVPAVSNLAITNPVNSTIPLSWAIPGICDLSKPVEPLSQNIKNENGLSTVTSLTYNPSENSVTAIGNSKGYCQYGVAFNIPQVNNIESITIDCKENEDPYVKGITLWGGVIERDNGVYDSDAGKTLYPTYWQYSSDLHNYRPTDWEKRSFTMDLGYWDSPSYVKADKYIQQIAVFANTWNSGDGVTGVSFSVREVRYHIDGQIDVDHVVLMRKEGSAATGIDDAGATQLYSGPNSQFTDEEAKTPGTTYYYTVFAVDADGNVSAAVSTSHTIETVATCTVSYDANGGSGTAPTDDAEYAAGGTITMPNANALSKPFSSVSGWKKGNAGDLIPIGETYTVTAADVEAGSISFYAQWVEDATTIRIPTVTVLNYSNQSTSVPTTDYWDVTDDGINDVCLDMSNRTAEWNVFITPGIYDISTICAVPQWGISYRLSIVDPLTESQVMELFYEFTSGAQYVPIISNLTSTFDLSSLVEGKRYIIRVQDTWTGCSLLVHDIIFSPQTPSLTTHTRNLPIGEYGTICLPYEVQAANIAGADVFELAGWPAESNAVTLNQIAGNMAAGHPYIFQATAATSTFSYEESGYQDAQSVNGLIGSYTQETITPNDNNFIIYNNQLYLVDVLAYVGANRAYINRTAAESAVASPAPGRRQIKLYVAGTEVATGLDQINGTCPDGKFIQDGQLFIRRDGRTYNAQGAMIK